MRSFLVDCNKRVEIWSEWGSSGIFLSLLYCSYYYIALQHHKSVLNSTFIFSFISFIFSFFILIKKQIKPKCSFFFFFFNKTSYWRFCLKIRFMSAHTGFLALSQTMVLCQWGSKDLNVTETWKGDSSAVLWRQSAGTKLLEAKTTH